MNQANRLKALGNTMDNKRLKRDTNNEYVAGVCSGIANYFDTDVTLVRLSFILGILFSGNVLLLYLILWLCMPK